MADDSFCHDVRSRRELARIRALVEAAGYDVSDGDMYLLKAWPVWDPLRSDPRFQDLLRRMNFPD